MAKTRRLSDAEIALTKAMLRKGWRNDAIHYYFNRPDRLISSGRIAQIKSGKYGAGVDEASAEELDAFLAARVNPQVGQTPEISVVDQAVLRSMFSREAGAWKLTAGETDRSECKANFRLHPEDRFSKAVRAIAGLANNKGGYLFFGITDGTFQADGMTDDTFVKSDISHLNRILVGSLDPVPHVTKGRIELGGRQIGVLYVAKHESAPVIAIKNIGQDVKEGGIYFRYVGETRLIKAGELRQIISAREHKAVSEFSSRMNRVATGRDAIINLDSGEVAGTSGRFVIDEALLSSIQFIREGEFSEAHGAPALRLIGDVEPVSASERERTRIIRENVTPDAVIRNFLLGENVAEPMQYIHFQAHAQRKWFPVWFYVNQTRAAASEIVVDLNSRVATYPLSRDAVANRLLGRESAYRKSTGKAAALESKLLKGDISVPTNTDDDFVFALAIQSLPTTIKRREAIQLCAALLQCLDRIRDGDPKSNSRRGAIYRAASRLDEILRTATRK